MYCIYAFIPFIRIGDVDLDYTFHSSEMFSWASVAGSLLQEVCFNIVLQSYFTAQAAELY